MSENGSIKEVPAGAKAQNGPTLETPPAERITLGLDGPQVVVRTFGWSDSRRQRLLPAESAMSAAAFRMGFTGEARVGRTPKASWSKFTEPTIEAAEVIYEEPAPRLK